MSVQDKGESLGPASNSVIRNNSDQMLMGAITPPAQTIPSKEMGSLGDELTPKVRKPYTITKQRERWTEDEHNRFLEALKLYGRAWRRIEEHIGTKTAVQIRSHAQKFFYKVVRDATGGGAGSAEHIEIPPPRPKRKPVHPYPRKLGHSSHKFVAGKAPKERSPSPISSLSGQDNRSPTSVLSVVGSDGTGTSASNRPNPCMSRDSSDSGLMNPVGQVISEQENQSGSPLLSGGEVIVSQSRDSATVGFATRVANFPMKTDVSSELCLCSEGSSSEEEAPPTSLKLFGRTVLVANSPKASSYPAGCAPGTDDKNPQKDTVDDQAELRSQSQRDFSGVPSETGFNAWPCGVMPLMIYRTDFPPELVNMTEATTPSLLPWWAYGVVPCTVAHPYSINPQEQAVPRRPEEDTDVRGEVQESSFTGSCTAAVGEATVGDKNTEPIDSVRRRTQLSAGEKEMTPGGNLALTRKRAAASGNQAKGFVPYRRCLAEREVEPLKMGSDERQCQRVRLCL